jgi:hypothetical protein
MREINFEHNIMPWSKIRPYFYRDILINILENLLLLEKKIIINYVWTLNQPIMINCTKSKINNFLNTTKTIDLLNFDLKNIVIANYFSKDQIIKEKILQIIQDNLIVFFENFIMSKSELEHYKCTKGFFKFYYSKKFIKIKSSEYYI